MATVRDALASLPGWLARSWVSIGFAVAFFVLWEALVRGFEMPRYIVPAPSAIFYQFFRNLPRIWDYTLVTGGETLMGFAFAPLVEKLLIPWHISQRAPVQGARG